MYWHMGPFNPPTHYVHNNRLYFAEEAFVGLNNAPNLKFLNFYHVMQLFGPAGPFSTVYLPLDQVVLGDNEQRVTFNSLFSLGVEDFRQLKQSSNPNPDENQAMKIKR